MYTTRLKTLDSTSVIELNVEMFEKTGSLSLALSIIPNGAKSGSFVMISVGKVTVFFNYTWH